jgi:hypothetical protein
MTDNRFGSGRHSIALVTTAIVSLGTAAAVGWAAAVPAGGSVATASSPAPGGGTTRTVLQINTAQKNLQQVRRDLARLLSREDDLPRAKLENLSALVAQLPSVQVPQSTTQPTVTHVTPPATHTTTGASGARP